jgi:hypothetical protein
MKWFVRLSVERRSKIEDNIKEVKSSLKGDVTSCQNETREQVSGEISRLNQLKTG